MAFFLRRSKGPNSISGAKEVPIPHNRACSLEGAHARTTLKGTGKEKDLIQTRIA
jgi:hypothetical protein